MKSFKKQRLYVNKVAVDVFFRKDINIETIEKAVVIVNGFPDFIGPTAMTDLFVQDGYIVFQPHMIGTFDSEGSFSPIGNEKTFRALDRMINESVGAVTPISDESKQKWKAKSILLIGHSFGGLIVLRNFMKLQNLKGIAFTSPALHYGEKYGCKEIGPEHYTDIGDRYPFTYRLAPLYSWNGILEGKDELPSEPIGFADKVITIYGSEDKYFDLDKAQENVPNLLKTYINSKSIELKIINNVGHPAAELVSNSGVCELLLGFLKSL